MQQKYATAQIIGNIFLVPEFRLRKFKEPRHIAAPERLTRWLEKELRCGKH